MILSILANRPIFRSLVLVLASLTAGILWSCCFLLPEADRTAMLVWALLATLLLPVALLWLQHLQHRHVRRVLFLLDAIENNDHAIRFSDDHASSDTRLVNEALNRVARILYNVKSDTIQQEKYYELILDCVNTGIIVLNDKGSVYQKNAEALRLLGLEVFTHVSQLDRIDSRLTHLFTHCRAGDKLQLPFSNERGTVNLSIRVSHINIHNQPLRILALNDINSELDEKEIDSWIRLTRVLTHEIMNAVTPITSLSDTLQELTHDENELRRGLQTISSTGKGLLSFVENYRKFTRIPTPMPSLFYVREFMERMVELAHHQYPDAEIDYQIDITPGDLILYADENLITQVVVNLLKNAVQAMDSAGIIRIHAYCDESESVFIEISNNGPAIPGEIAEHIFIPFFTTKEGGSGIGLSVSRQIMRLSGGNISLRHHAEETTFVLQFK